MSPPLLTSLQGRQRQPLPRRTELKPFSALSIPKRRDAATWADAGRANSPCDLVRDLADLHPDGISSTQCLTSCPTLGNEEKGRSRDSRAVGDKAERPLRSSPVSMYSRNRCLHPHELTAAMQVKTTSLLRLRVFSHGPARSCYKRGVMRKDKQHTPICADFLAWCVVLEWQDVPCFQVKTKKKPQKTSTSPRGFIYILISVPLQHAALQRSREKCRAWGYSWSWPCKVPVAWKAGGGVEGQRFPAGFPFCSFS